MLLEVKHLNVYYDGKHILKDVSFDVGNGEFFAIVGESGSGKSSIAKAIMGLIRYEGLINFNGDDIFMIFQDPGNYLDPLFKVYNQIKMVKEAVKTKKGIDIDKAISLVGLNHQELKSKYPHQLSGGQKQRVMIAMALSRGSSLVIADEPTSSLDVLVQKDVLCAFKNMRTYFNLIVITHDINVVYHIADRVLVLKDGIVQEISSKEDFFKSPKSEYGKKLLESFY